MGIDDGQGLLKVMMSVKKTEPQEEVEKKKAKYEEGFSPKDFKFSGVKKLILLLVSPSTEDHDNMSALLSQLGIKAIEFGYSCDLKMVLMLLGKQSASSKYYCPFCTGCSPWQDEYAAITIKSLWEDYKSYVKAGSDLKKAMNFHNVVNPPLVTGRDDPKILGDLFFFPEHHVFTGIVGKLVKELEKNVFDSPEEGNTFLNEWKASPGIYVSRTVWHGSASFIVNIAHRLLKMVDDLLTRLKGFLAPYKLELAEVYIKAFKQFKSVVDSCFGQTLTADYATQIKDFMVTYRSLQISVPLKVRLYIVFLMQINWYTYVYVFFMFVCLYLCSCI